MINIRPVSDLRNKYPEIEELVLKEDEAVYLTKNGYGSMVVMSLEKYAKLMSNKEYEDYIENEPETGFSVQLKKAMKEFLEALPDLKVEKLNPRVKKTKLSLFATRDRKEEFGENYCTTYLASFAQLAQAQRHRTLSYEMSLLDKPEYYVPRIIRGTELEKEWLEDISSLEKYYPQGMLVEVNERGTVENFVLKCTERLCGAAQLEIMEQTVETMNKYLEAVKNDPNIESYLLPYSKGARCTFPGWKCNSPCIFGGKKAMTRKI